MTSFTFAILLALLPISMVLSADDKCNPGDKSTKANINYLCSKVGDKTTFYPVSCQSDTKVDVLPGKTFSDPNFKWSCSAGDEPNTMIWQVDSCFSPASKPIALDAFVYEDGGAYFCEHNGTAANGARIVSRRFTKNLQCKDEAGKAYNLGDTYSDAKYFYKCSLSNNVPTISIVGCKTATGKNLGIGSVGEDHMCQKDAKGTITLVPYTLECKDAAGSHDINEYWILGSLQYQCTLNSTQKPVITLKKCAANITYTDAKGKKQVQTNFLVGTDSIGTASDKVIYWCQGVGTGASKTYKLVPLPADKQNCTNAAKTPLNAKYNNGTGVYQCQWVGNTPTIRATGCVDAAGKTYSNGAIIDHGSYGVICVCTSTTAQLRNMTAAEYTKYKSTGNFVSASGTSGAGIEWYDASGKLQCHEGYEVSNNKCVDINECVQAESPCDAGSEKCVNSEGSFNCYCTSGFARYRADNKCEEIACPCGHSA